MIISINGSERNSGKSTIAALMASFFYNIAGHKVALVNPDSNNVIESYFFKEYKTNFELSTLEKIDDPLLLSSASNSVAEEFDIFSNHLSSASVTANQIRILKKHYDTIIIDGPFNEADFKINIATDTVKKMMIDSNADMNILNRFDKNASKVSNAIYCYEYFSSIKQYSNDQNLYQLLLKKQKAIEHFKPIFTDVFNKRC